MMCIFTIPRRKASKHLSNSLCSFCVSTGEYQHSARGLILFGVVCKLHHRSFTSVDSEWAAMKRLMNERGESMDALRGDSHITSPLSLCSASISHSKYVQRPQRFTSARRSGCPGERRLGRCILYGPEVNLQKTNDVCARRSSCEVAGRVRCHNPMTDETSTMWRGGTRGGKVSVFK